MKACQEFMLKVTINEDPAVRKMMAPPAEWDWQSLVNEEIEVEWASPFAQGDDHQYVILNVTTYGDDGEITRPSDWDWRALTDAEAVVEWAGLFVGQADSTYDAMLTY